MSNAQAYDRALRPLLGQATGYARALLRSRADAEDAVQAAALKGWERLAQYDDTQPFKGWWFGILRNICLDQLRRTNVRRTEPLDGHDPAAPTEQAPLDWRQLDDAMRRLSGPHQEILRLKYFGELKYDELAVALSIPKGTVMSRLHLARKALAAEYTKEIP